VSPSEKRKGILKYLGSNRTLATTSHDGQELVTDTNVSPSASSPSKKPKGILKYLGSNSPLPTSENDKLELVTTDRSFLFPTNEASQLHTDEDVSPCNPADGVVDLETVDVDEQRHILEGIYRSKHSRSAGSSLQSSKRGRKPVYRVGSSKRAREQPSVSQPKQPGIGTYFQARDKPQS